MKIRLFGSLAGYLVFIFASLTRTAVDAAPTSPGTYTDWNGQISHLTIVQSFKAAGYKKLVVKPVITEGVDLPDESESTYRPVTETLDRATSFFLEGIRETAPRFLEVEQNKAEKMRLGDALVVTARVAKMDPGSWSGRAFGRGKLFHAATDAAETRITGEVNDAASGKVLLRFTQRHRAGLALFGGAYDKLLERTIHDIGADVGHMIGSF